MGKSAVFQDDELYLILRGRTYHLMGTFEGRRIRRSTGTADLARAKIFLENVRRELMEGWREDYDSIDVGWRDVAKTLYDRHKGSSVQRGIPFDLKVGEIFNLMKSTSFRCAVSGIPFAKRLIKDGKRDPWGPSLDRIENRQGYSIENVRVVCIAANIAMADWGLDVLLRLSRGIHRSSLMLAEELTPNEHAADTIDCKPLISIVNSN